MGIAGQMVILTPRMIGANQLQVKTGVYVYEILPDADIYNSQFRLGDIIVEFEGRTVHSVDNLHKYLTEETIGKIIKVGVLRNGHKQIVSVIPGELK